MRCRKHPADHSSSVGVCATCLRQRLFTIIIASQKPQFESHPLPFPRSVSPYISRRKSDTSTWQQQTPQITDSKTVKKGRGRISSLFFSLFGGSKSRKSDPDPRTQTRNYSTNRGMSPIRYSDAGGDEMLSSGLSSSVKMTPARVGNISSVFCLSPLVRPSPNRRGLESVSHLSTAPSFCKNRSRKLADIGRCNFNPNY